jgi:hypothetical protein
MGDPQPTPEQALHEVQQASARRVLDSYQRAHGRPATSMDDLIAWLEANPDAVPLDERGHAVPLYED